MQTISFLNERTWIPKTIRVSSVLETVLEESTKTRYKTSCEKLERLSVSSTF